MPEGVTVHCWSAAPLQGSITTLAKLEVEPLATWRQSPDGPPTIAPLDWIVQFSLGLPLQV